MMILLGLVTVVYLWVGALLIVQTLTNDDNFISSLYLALTLGWWIMIPAICAQYKIFTYI